MAPPNRKKKKFSSDKRRLISSTAISEHAQQSMGSFVTSFGKRRSVRVAKKMNRPLWSKLKRRICTDVLMDILPFFDRSQLGLKMALISPHFDVLVDTHFNGKSEFTIWRWIEIRKDCPIRNGRDKDKGMPKLFVTGKAEGFPLPDRQLPNKICFKRLHISYIDHLVIAFLRSNKHILFGRGTHLDLFVWAYKSDVKPIWDVFVREIWPFFVTNIRHLGFTCGDHLDNLLGRISPTILSDLQRLNSISSIGLLSNVFDDFDGPNATAAGQALSKWLHNPTKDGQPKQLRCFAYDYKETFQWFTKFKEQFLRSTSSGSYTIQFNVRESTPIVPFELVNNQTNEKLTLSKQSDNKWQMKRCQIGVTKSEDENSNNLNNIHFTLCGDCVGPLSPSAAGQSGGKGRRIVRK